MYYILKEDIGLCGYKGLPFGLDDLHGIDVRFYTRELYELILMFDGQTEIQRENLSEKQKDLFDEFIKKKFILETKEKVSLLKTQEYRFYPVMSKKSVQWSITGACNYRCKHCFMSAPTFKYKNPTKEECMYIISQLSECGVKGVTLTGGEPLVSPWFLDILDEFNKRNIQVTGILSNAALLNEEMIKEIKKRNSRVSFQISFDGLGWHDWLRGVSGAEEKTLKAFKLLKENGMTFDVTMCLHKHNLETVNRTIRCLDELGAHHLKISVALPTGLWEKETEHFLSQEEADEYMLEKAIPEYLKDNLSIAVQFCSILDYYPNTKDAFIPLAKFSGTENALNSYACTQIRDNFHISPDGDVLPCMTMLNTNIQKHYENIYKTPLKDILNYEYYENQCYVKVKDILSRNEKCKDCEYRFYCGGGCRACKNNCEKCNYYGVDEASCKYFKDGWYNKSKELIEKIKKGIIL